MTNPHGGVPPFHQKSTCISQLFSGPYVVEIWPLDTLKNRGNETLELHTVDVFNFNTVSLALHTVDFEGFMPQNLEGSVTKFALHKALKLMWARRKPEPRKQIADALAVLPKLGRGLDVNVKFQKVNTPPKSKPFHESQRPSQKYTIS